MMSWLRPLASAGVLCALAFTAPQVAQAVDASDLLPVDQAFALTANASGNQQITLHWAIAKGYYLYRQRISVQAVAGMQADTLQLPQGEAHHDPFFGDVQTYRGQLTATLPGAPTGGIVQLKVKYQGCADLGVCYPPQTRMLNVALPDAAAASSTPDSASGDSGFGALGRSLSGAAAPGTDASPAGLADAQPLPAEQAFAFEAIVGDPQKLLLRFTPAKGYYLYRDKTSLKLTGDRGTTLGSPAWPQGTLHRDEHFGSVVVYFDQVDVPLPLVRTDAEPADVTLTATFQGCQTGGICYPPMTRIVALQLPAVTATPAAPVRATEVATSGPSSIPGRAATSVAPTTAPLANTADAAPVAAEDSRLAAALAGTNRWLALLGFFGAGLLLAFTPCVLPMIPILSGLIAGHGTRLGTGRALLLSLVYVLANALVFTAAGIVAGLLGANLQAAFQNRWIIVAFAALFVALALSSFGAFELQLPAALRSRLGAITDRQRGGSMAGVAAMGALSALIVGPCVAPPLAGAVLYIGQSHDPVFGGAALFLLAMGMGMPLLAFGAAAGRGMPTSGPWMTAAQRVFGFVFLGLAIWMVSRILPAAATLALWGLLALSAAAWIWSGATPTSRNRWLVRFAGLVLGLVGAAQLLGAMAGGSDPLQPLAGIAGARQPATALVFRTIKSNADLDRALTAARDAGKPVLFDFYADWCVSCKEMDRDTFSDPAVNAALAGFVLLKADVTANDAVDQALMQRFGIIGPPATLFFRRGNERRPLRLIGFEKSAPFIERVRSAAQ
ncbi:MAG: thiol:disulfide interchange protein [Xanthomonadaceae bacterium]|nr:thiol:disulfide interchange protein [Xanthomonadaceae bacterium]